MLKTNQQYLQKQRIDKIFLVCFIYETNTFYTRNRRPFPLFQATYLTIQSQHEKVSFGHKIQEKRRYFLDIYQICGIFVGNNHLIGNNKAL